MFSQFRPAFLNWYFTTKEKVKSSKQMIAEVIGISIAILIIFYAVHHLLTKDHANAAAPVVVATPAKVVAYEPKQEVIIKKPIKVYKHGQAIKSRIELPDSVIQDPTIEVLSAVEVKQDDHPHTVTTVINTETGDTQTYTRTEPLPWLSFKNSGEAGVYLGMKNGTPAVRLDMREDFLSVKSVNLGLRGSVDQSSNGQTDIFVGVGGAYRW